MHQPINLLRTMSEIQACIKYQSENDDSSRILSLPLASLLLYFRSINRLSYHCVLILSQMDTRNMLMFFCCLSNNLTRASILNRCLLSYLKSIILSKIDKPSFSTFLQIIRVKMFVMQNLRVLTSCLYKSTSFIFIYGTLHRHITVGLDYIQQLHTSPPDILSLSVNLFISRQISMGRICALIRTSLSIKNTFYRPYILSTMDIK